MVKANILIVEDELLVAKDIQNRLQKFGYSVVGIAASSKEAMKKVAETSPDLVLMDIRIKGNIDGIETGENIYRNYNIPIVYLTANADDSTLERAKLTEPFGYILKPFKEKELKTTIEITLTKHQVEKKLKQSEQWLATVLKSIGDAVITSDAAGTVTFMNYAAESLTGWKQEDAYGKDANEIVNFTHEETNLKVESPIIQALKKGMIVGLPEQTILINKYGSQIPIDDSAAPIRDDKGNITGAVLVFRDVTERQQAKLAHQKQLEQERLVAQLEKLNQLKDDFLSTVSHELRTPIANMKMAIQMLKLADGKKERAQRYLEILHSECIRESELIDDLLDLQRLETASYPTLLSEAIDLKDWLPKIVEPFRTRLEQRQQILQINFPPDLPPLVSDCNSLERIIVELTNNACKYTAAGGEIVLSVHYIGKKQPVGTCAKKIAAHCSEIIDVNKLELVQTSEFISNNKTIITISNHAEISSEHLPRVFEKFYRVPKGDRWQQGGTGLGLALVQKLVEYLQGSIKVNSSQGWTTFTLELNNLTANNDVAKLKEENLQVEAQAKIQASEQD